MTDHLEPYRRMARSIRFVPPQWQAERFYRALTQTSMGTPTFAVSGATVPSVAKSPASTPDPDPDPGPAPDPSEHLAALIRDAVSKPTVVVTSYNIPENIGDRISKLAEPRPRAVIMPPPKLPAPDPNWVPAPQIAAVQPDPVRADTDAVDLAVASTISPSTVISEGQATLPVTEPDLLPSKVLVEAPVPAIAPLSVATNDMSDPKIVTATEEPIVPSEVTSESRPVTSPTVEELNNTPVTAAQSAKRGGRKQAQGFRPSKKQRKA